MLQVPLHKKANGLGGFYGQPEDADPAPARVSIATFDTNFAGEPLHYSTGQQKLYITHSGEAILEVEGQEVTMTPANMIVVRSGEKHRILRVITKIQFTVVMMGPINDKVIVEE